MGGFGSGRPSGPARDAVESCLSLDVGLLHKTACLQAGWSGFLQWTRAGKRAAVIGLRAEADCIHLYYRARTGGGEWEEVSENVKNGGRRVLGERSSKQKRMGGPEGL
jgi:hypothetical protein